jgi:hypothetical protein
MEGVGLSAGSRDFWLGASMVVAAGAIAAVRASGGKCLWLLFVAAIGCLVAGMYLFGPRARWSRRAAALTLGLVLIVAGAAAGSFLLDLRIRTCIREYDKFITAGEELKGPWCLKVSEKAPSRTDDITLLFLDTRYRKAIAHAPSRGAVSDFQLEGWCFSRIEESWYTARLCSTR